MTGKRKLKPHVKRLYELRRIWRDQIFFDRSLTPSTFKVGYALADCMTMSDTVRWFLESGCKRVIVYPSQEMLSSAANVSVDTVRVGIAHLITKGHLKKLKRGNQFTGSNTYRIVFQEGSDASI